MKRAITLSLLVNFLMVGSALGQSDEPTRQSREEVRKANPIELKRDIEQTEIREGELPKRARKDIIENYHNARIIRALRIQRPGEEKHGYLVQVEKPGKVWTIEYDHQGNPKNKVLPMK